MGRMTALLRVAARSDRLGTSLARVGPVVVPVRIGGLERFRYEDEGIVPFVANSPVMSFFHRQPAGEYRKHLNREGEVVPANRAWHDENGTFALACGLGPVIVGSGVMIALHPWLPRVAAVGSSLVVGMSPTTPSFPITKPECWVASLGGPEHGFPQLSGAGRLVVKDAIMLGAGVATMADSAQPALRNATRSDSNPGPEEA